MIRAYDRELHSIGQIGAAADSVINFYTGIYLVQGFLQTLSQPVFLEHTAPAEMADLLETECRQLRKTLEDAQIAITALIAAKE